MSTVATQAPIEVEAPPTAAELLRRAAYRVGQPGAWAQHCLALTEDGRLSFARSESRFANIRSRCLLGALYVEHDVTPKADIHSAYEAVVRSIGTSCIADWNDAAHRTQDDVVTALIKASEIAEGAE